MAMVAELRRHAEHCRYLADITVSPHDRQVLRKSAAEFDSQAERLEAKRFPIAELPKSER